MWDVYFDIEANGLLDENTIDYSVLPYQIKPSYVTHCIVADIVVQSGQRFIYAFYEGDTIPLDGREYQITCGEQTFSFSGYKPIKYIHKPLNTFKTFVEDHLPEGSVISGHNIINFDLLSCKLTMGMDFEVEIDPYTPLGDDSWCGKKIIFNDTLVKAKTLNPDRHGGNSLDNLSKDCQDSKMQFRKNIPIEIRFASFGADMLYYCILDCMANRAVGNNLNAEQQAWEWGDKWNRAIKLEKKVAEIITRQSHRGFYFDKSLAEDCLVELDQMLEERRERIEAILPPKKPTKKLLDEYTPCKRQFKKNGEVSADLEKWAVKVGAILDQENKTLSFNGITHSLPLPTTESLITNVPAKVNDTTHIKEWLVSLGWNPIEYKEKDITTNSKKEKKSPESLEKSVDDYVEQTVNSSFMFHRCEHLGMPVTSRMDKTVIKRKLKELILKKASRGYGVKVMTNPSFTVGLEKEICSNLLMFLNNKTEYKEITDIVEYLTYRHRRNSILGSGISFEDFEDDDIDVDDVKGYLPNVREDNRIATPADTCGAATSRFKHRKVANIPRCSSLYGSKMRAIFGVDNTCYQVGYDFDSLEARQEANYCWPFDDDLKEYCKSLLQEKPNDCHTIIAGKISEILGKKFERTPAKSVKYGATYGAQVAKVAKMLGCDMATAQIVFDAFWESALPLKKFKEHVTVEWEGFDKRRIVGIDDRLVPTRSAHAILNSKFQSAGVICAKRAMVLHDFYLKKEGLLVDFFREVPKNSWGQQLVAYHDECQLEVDKQSVKFKMFATKEEAQAFKDSQEQVWSDIAHSPKGGFYVAYNRAGELATEAVTQAGRDYGMVIDLTAGYIVGRNWAECH